MTTDKIYTTLARIRAQSPCEDGYKKLCKNLGGIEAYGEDTPLTFKQIYESNGYSDTMWCLCTVEEKWNPLLRHFSCDMAEGVKHLMKDERSLKAIEVARRYADGKATYEELKDAAWDSARAAARAAADSAWAAARAAADAAAMDDAIAAAMDDAIAAAMAAADAAWDSALDSALDSARAAAMDDAIAAARAAAWDVRDAQMQYLFKYCATGERQYGFTLNNGDEK